MFSGVAEKKIPASFSLASVNLKRVEEVASFHVSEKSDITEGNLIGLVVYDLDGQREFKINGQAIKEGLIYFRSPESIKNVQAEGSNHAKLFYSFFGHEWDELRNRMTVSGFARQNGIWKRTSRTFNSNDGENYSYNNDKDMNDVEFDKITEKSQEFLTLQATPFSDGSKIEITQTDLLKNPLKKHHSSLPLEIYQNFVHVRDHTLYHAYTKEVPKILRLPVIDFLVAMSVNQHSKHPIRDSLVDLSVEEAALTVLGSAIGHVPAAVTLTASHLAEKGLEHFPSWEEIDKWPRSTPEERIVYSRMIEARSTAELLTWPSQATEKVSHSIKKFFDHLSSRMNQAKEDITLKSSLNTPALFSQPLSTSLSGSNNKISSSFAGLKLTKLSFSQPLPPMNTHIPSSRPFVYTHKESVTWNQSNRIGNFTRDGTSISSSLTALNYSNLSDNLRPKSSLDPTSRSYTVKTYPKLTGLSDGLQPKTAWDGISSKVNQRSDIELVGGEKFLPTYSIFKTKSVTAPSFKNLGCGLSFNK